MDYEGLFGMLFWNRFDYFPRGINEIFLELEARERDFPTLCIEPTLALYFPTPSYFFVSPKAPILAKRIQRGLEILIASGEFDAMFDAKYGEDIKRAHLETRTVFTLENMLLSDDTPFDRPELWYAP